MSTPRSGGGPPRSPCEASESTLQRQGRARPNSEASVVSDISFTQCAVCLESFALREKMWGLPCGRQCRAEYCGRNARAQASRGRAGAHVEAPCVMCREPGINVAEHPYVGH
eukprot:5592975-Pyramimonas_sp.AAC.1